MNDSDSSTPLHLRRQEARASSRWVIFFLLILLVFVVENILYSRHLSGAEAASPDGGDEIGECDVTNEDGTCASQDGDDFYGGEKDIDDDDEEFNNDDEEEFFLLEVPECPSPEQYDEERCIEMVKAGICHHAAEGNVITALDRELNFDDEVDGLTDAGIAMSCCEDFCYDYLDPDQPPVLEDGEELEDALDEILDNIDWFFHKSQPQKVQLENEGQSDDIVETLRQMDVYLRTELAAKTEYNDVRENCFNRHPLCAYWASNGECEDKSSMTACAPVCKSCLDLDPRHRCPKDPNAAPVYKPGDLQFMFERIANGAWDELAPTVISRPTSSEADDKPWVVTFDDFMSDEECDRLIELGEKEGYERSTDVGKVKFDGSLDETVSTARTSENAWCMDECYEDVLAKAVMKRIEDVTGIPETNSEHLQLLKYEVGQYYDVHHDFIDEDYGHPVGHRMLTFFLYLSDVEEGGGTNFPDLNITVMPKKGKALLWPSVLNSDTSVKDERTRHRALPVINGEKYAANAWLHEFDFKTQHDKGCT